MNLKTNQSKIHIDSEIAPLKKVLIHTPGPEVECMSPQDTERFLFHNVVFVKDLIKGYSVFKGILSKFSKVYEIKECLADVFENREIREKCITQVLNYYGHPQYKNELLSLDNHTLARALIEGYERKTSSAHHSHPSLVADERYIVQPLPNLYFTRDTSIVVGKKVISPHMAYPVRFIETVLTRTIFANHPDFHGEGFLIDASTPENNNSSFTIEGGDVHVWHKDLYLIGVSARTNSTAVDAFIDALIKDRKQKNDDTPFHILAVFLPKTPSMIHLDMMFTRVSENQALGYAPALIGPNSFRTVKISVTKFDQKHTEDMGSLLTALKAIGYSIDPIFCGGNSLISQEREQWVSGTNSVALMPGKIISYENEHTLKSLEKSGFKIISGKDFIKDSDTTTSQENIVITIDGSQLAQGGGGPRCMTCPILRGNI